MYQLISDDNGAAAYVVDTDRKLAIPLDPANTDYQAYLAWVEKGNIPEFAPVIEPPAPPTPEEKLAASGLTVEELKTLLGL